MSGSIPLVGIFGQSNALFDGEDIGIRDAFRSRGSFALVKYAMAGTAINQNSDFDWNVNSSHELLDTSLRLFLERENYIIRQGYTISSKTWMFTQGETDAKTESSALLYDSNIDAMLNKIWNTVGSDTKIFIPLLSSDFPYTDIIRAAQFHIAEKYSNVILYETEGLNFEPDGIHYNFEGRYSIGYNMVQILDLKSNVSDYRDLYHDNDILGTNMDDIIRTGVWDDTVLSYGGNDTISVGDGNNIVNAGAGDDSITALFGNDNLVGGDGNDLIIASPFQKFFNFNNVSQNFIQMIDQDTIKGGNGDDLIKDYTGTNVISGGDGDDSIFGGNWIDNIGGNSGDDLISGGKSRDILYGREGFDIFSYSSITDSNKDFGIDVIKDFEVGIDKIDLHAVSENLNFIGEGLPELNEIGYIHTSNDYTQVIVNVDNSSNLYINLFNNLSLNTTDFII